MTIEKDNPPMRQVGWGENEKSTGQEIKIPAFLNLFGSKTPAQFLAKYIAKEKLEAVAGAMAGFVDIGIELPAWVKKASWRFWTNYLGDKPLNPWESIEDFGVMVKLIELYSLGNFDEKKSVKPSSKLDKWTEKIAGKLVWLFMQKMVPELSDVEKSKFYAGRARAVEIIEKIQNPDYLKMVKRAHVYLLIAAAWKKIEGFSSHAERERWLRSEKAIDENFNSREVYNIFEVIGLPGATPGRPKKLQT